MHRPQTNRFFYSMAFCGFLLTLSIFFSSVAEAQIGTSAPYLSATPDLPEPNKTVTLALNDYSVNTVGASIAWFVDGVEHVESRNDRSITVTAGDLGETTAVRAAITLQSGATISVSHTIVPTVVDLIVEANTAVPSFYKGRTLPSLESKVRVIALVHDSSGRAESACTYKWTLGTTVLDGGPLRGKNSMEITIPRYGDGRLMVEVLNNDGELVGRETVFLTPVEPEIHFYEVSPLRGIGMREISSPLPFIGEETTIYGEAYFLNNESAVYAWSIDGSPASADAGNPNAITLRHVGGEGGSRIDLSVQTEGRIPQALNGSFNLVF